MNRSGRTLNGRQIAAQAQQIWISHMEKSVFFTQKTGYETKMFLSIKELMDFVKDYVEQGYKVG